MTSLLGRHRTRVCTVWLGIGLSIALSGCVVGSKGMQIDSTSRMPWFNLELKERKKKAEGPAFRSVRSDKGAKSRVDMLGMFGGKSSSTATVETDKSLPTKSATALPTTDQSLVLDSTTSREPAVPDFR